jgi:hypothetical protein
VIGAAIGGTWTVKDICKTCQKWAGEEIDGPFAQTIFLQEKRHRLKIPDRYGNLPDAPTQDVTLVDGRRGRITFKADGNGPELEIFPSRIDLGDGRSTIQISVNQELAYLEKLRQRFEKANPGFTFEVSSREIASHDPVEVTHPITWSLTLWPRFGVKVAMNVGRELWGKNWLTSDHGMLLHRLLWGTETRIKMNPFPTTGPISQGLPIENGPDHLLWVNRGPRGEPMLLIQLFGEETYGVPLGPSTLPEKTVWLLHVHQGSHEHVTEDEYFHRILMSLPRQEIDYGE